MPNNSLTSKKNLCRTISLLFYILSSHFVTAQEHKHDAIINIIPIGNAVGQHFTNASIQQSNADTLVLPFWEDFSNANYNTTDNERFVPSPERWAEGSQTVRVNTGLDINAPTVGIATFDGVNENGRPYSTQPTEMGLADSLVSLPIDLSVVPVNQRQSVYFSFFWQQFGLGEFPDQEDSIRLQFKNAQNVWITQWSKSGGDTLITDQFTQEMIQVVNPGFFHNGFQFRFQSYNRLSGAFDTWNIDYIFFNSQRTASNTAYLDRALASLPTSPFGEYTAVPMKQFREAPERYLGSSSVEFYNLNVQLQPVRFTALLRDQVSGNIIQILNDDNALSPIPSGFDRRTITSNPLELAALDLDQDSLYVETEFNITSGDNYLVAQVVAGDTLFYTNVDYRVNDTVRATFVLDEQFAYDDGEAEFGVEINQNGGKIAYQFVAPKKDLLTHINIYFPPLARNQSATPFRLMVWQSLEDTLGEEVVLRAQQAQTSASDQINQFTSFELSSPVVVEDTFYIGYEQQGESFIAIGFDKNTNASDKTFYNVTGEWAQDSVLRGSLMMRPGFDKSRNVTGSDDPVIVEKEELQIFPNPSSGSFKVSQPFVELYIYDVTGKLLKHFVSDGYSQESVETNLTKGVYLVRIFAQGEYSSRKLIIQ
ncbi:T9SS type A sorting domain-containing protein [Catalinimonas niigatensis]|uniref:T9SS type A sorting domain-containing protein n=1 Tax=Catalinimonas niigatensis TaxID=1397264 RepID=UPI00266624C9|nr:T9SS type A sorting domain-containing protein [Catalinimonas niigatensis]WPP51409.1 T9SS type A sorting domain-containing protein [Catalinimonas niigatensis]